MSADGKRLPRKLPALIPWIEVNQVRRSWIEHAIAGLKQWRRVADTAIVSTAPDCAELYHWLRDARLKMRIIQGIKSHPRLGREGENMDALTPWAVLACDVYAAAQAAGETTVLLEHETAFGNYYRGRRLVDFTRFSQCVRMLPAGIDYLWYPVLATRYAYGSALLATVQDRLELEGLDVRFVDFSIDQPAALRWYHRGSEAAAIAHIATRASIPIVYLGPDYWAYERLPEALVATDADTVILYPGATNWVAAAKAVARTLRDIREPQVREPK